MISVRLVVLSFFSIMLVASISALAEDSNAFTSKNIDGDDVVIDDKTKLVWQQGSADVNNDGSITKARYPGGDKMAWQDAVDYCKELVFAGSSDWRLPEGPELVGITDVSQSYPAINPIFQCEQDAYWSATNDANPAKAMYVHFNFGSESSKPKSQKLFVRCVRTVK